MAHLLEVGPATSPATTRTAVVAGGPAYQAYLILHVGFAVLPIVAGVDKFFNLLMHWETYLSPLATRVIPVDPHTFMLGVGVIEIIAGLLVAAWPRVGAYVVMLWLWGIIANLCLVPGFYDIALRDFGLSLGALALGRLSREFNPRPFGP